MLEVHPDRMRGIQLDSGPDRTLEIGATHIRVREIGIFEFGVRQHGDTQIGLGEQNCV